jgi:hypothetical protein
MVSLCIGWATGRVLPTLCSLPTQHRGGHIHRSTMSSRLILVVLLGLSLTSGNHGHGNTPLQTTSSSLQQHRLDDVAACPRLAAFTATTALPSLRRLVSDTAFFRYYRFRLCDACASERFAKGECASPECAVCECAENDLPCDTSGRCFLRPGAAIAASCQSSSDDDDGALDLALDVDGFAKWDPSASWLAPEDEKGQDTYVLPRACLPQLAHTRTHMCGPQLRAGHGQACTPGNPTAGQLADR